MRIQIRWGTGQMVTDADVMVEGMTLAQFKKWCKLFRLYGEENDQAAMIAFFQDKIQNLKGTVKQFDSEIAEYQGKIDGTIPSQLAKKYCREQIRLLSRHKNGAASTLKRVEGKYSVLKEVLKL